MPTSLSFKDDSMRVFSRIGLVSMAALAGLMASPARGQPQPERKAAHAIVCAVSSQSFSLADARGGYLALHFLQGDLDRSAKFVSAFLRSAPLAAGVRHLFIRADDPEAVKKWAATLDNHAASIYADASGALAKDLGITLEAPVTVVFDKDGVELFRRSGDRPDEHISWSDFAEQFAAKTRLPAIKEYNLPTGRPLALEGYDVVAYFKSPRAVKGKPELVSQYGGVMYRFSSEENRERFAADPEKFLPTYGGWCASAMGAKGTKVEIDPTNFKIKDGRLFLFYRGTFSNALKDWNKHEKEWEPAADANWKKLTNEDPIKHPK